MLHPNQIVQRSRVGEGVEFIPRASLRHRQPKLSQLSAIDSCGRILPEPCGKLNHIHNHGAKPSKTAQETKEVGLPPQRMRSCQTRGNCSAHAHRQHYTWPVLKPMCKTIASARFIHPPSPPSPRLVQVGPGWTSGVIIRLELKRACWLYNEVDA